MTQQLGVGRCRSRMMALVSPVQSASVSAVVAKSITAAGTHTHHLPPLTQIQPTAQREAETCVQKGVHVRCVQKGLQENLQLALV